MPWYFELYPPDTCDQGAIPRPISAVCTLLCSLVALCAQLLCRFHLQYAVQTLLKQLDERIRAANS